MTELEIINRLRSERAEAWERASVFARYADRLQKALEAIMSCPCCEQFSCADFASSRLEEANVEFHKEWILYKENFNVR